MLAGANISVGQRARRGHWVLSALRLCGGWWRWWWWGVMVKGGLWSTGQVAAATLAPDWRVPGSVFNVVSSSEIGLLHHSLCLSHKRTVKRLVT